MTIESVETNDPFLEYTGLSYEQVAEVFPLITDDEDTSDAYKEL